MIQFAAIAKKELKAYFGSPMAAIFIGTFLLAALFSFFWLETFFARNIADIRPLFRWMPLLLIFLTSSLTMRQWSEEQKMGTLEVLLTLPVKLSHLVVGKFLAVLALVGLALGCTIGLPITVSFLGNIDWGPVIGGYLGALLLASTYIAIGLFVSSRTDNQIIALILSVLISGLLYLLGSSGITVFTGNAAGEFLRNLGTGSRFLGIERGVIDLRDLAYYGSLTVFFLVLNSVSLESTRWSSGHSTMRHRRLIKIFVILIGANLLALNVWLQQYHTARFDLTEDREFSISQTTRDLIENLPEPLVVRGYFSAKTHPLLAPLVPRIRDFLQEYETAAGGRLSVSFIDPRNNEELEAEANQQYGIKPVPFQVAGRYEASVVNSYFNILIKYGDQYVTLDFNDLIEVRQQKDGEIEVGLRNLEYDLTKSIKKVVYGFQSLATVFEKMKPGSTLSLILTPSALPEQLASLPAAIREAGEALARESDGKLSFTEIDPDNPGSAFGRQALLAKFGIKPMPVSFLSDQSFYLHLLLISGETAENIYLGPDMGATEIRQEIEAVLKKTAAGFLKTLGVWTPKAPPAMGLHDQQPAEYRLFQELLREAYNVEQIDLGSGHVSGDVDVLLLVAPQQLTDLEKLAIDQYLMRGGSVVALAGNYTLDINPAAQSLNLKEIEGGLADVLAHYGITVEKSLVMDKQNEPFPVPVARDLGGFVVQEIRQLDYPFFVDVREDGMDKENVAVSSLPAVTMNWVSPLTIDDPKTAGLTVSTLLKSSAASWVTSETDIQPDFSRFPDNGFPAGESFSPRPLAVALKGSFAGYFADKEDPRLKKQDGTTGQAAGTSPQEKNGKPARKEESIPLVPVISRSPESARLVVVGSSEFISDAVISISQSMGKERILNNMEFLQNLIDWSVEDEGLLAIRSRGSHARLLYPLINKHQAIWEFANYGFALLLLVLVSWHGYRRRHREKPMLLEPS